MGLLLFVYASLCSKLKAKTSFFAWSTILKNLLQDKKFCPVINYTKKTRKNKKKHNYFPPLFNETIYNETKRIKLNKKKHNHISFPKYVGL